MTNDQEPSRHLPVIVAIATASVVAAAAAVALLANVDENARSARLHALSRLVEGVPVEGRTTAVVYALAETVLTNDADLTVTARPGSFPAVRLIAAPEGLVLLALPSSAAPASVETLGTVILKVQWRARFPIVGDRTVASAAAALAVLVFLLGMGTLRWSETRWQRPLAAALAAAHRRADLSDGLLMLAHDVRKPLGLARLTLGALARAPSPEAVQTAAAVYLPELAQALARADAMIDDALVFGKERTSPKTVGVTEIVERALHEAAGVHGGADVDIDYMWRHAHELSVDGARLVRALANLITNAVEAAGDGGQLWFRTREIVAGGVVRIELAVGNSGSYVPPAVAARLFEPYFSHGKRRGTGLGLAIVRRVVDEHGGAIRVVSDPEGGTEFVLTLPGAPGVPARPPMALPASFRDPVFSGSGDAAEAAGLAAARLSLAAGKDQALRVLVLDDDDAVRKEVAQALSISESAARHPKGQVPLESAPPRRLATVQAIAHRRDLLDRWRTVDALVCDMDLGDNGPNGIAILAAWRDAGWTGAFVLHTDQRLSDAEQRQLDRLGGVLLQKPTQRLRLYRALAEALQLVANSPQGKNAASSVRLPRIAVIDDDVFTRSSWEQDGVGARVETFGSPAEFLARIAGDAAFAASFDAILVDFFFASESDGDGAALARRLKDLTATPVLLASDLPAGHPLEPGLFAGRVAKEARSWRQIERAIGSNARRREREPAGVSASA